MKDKIETNLRMDATEKDSRPIVRISFLDEGIRIRVLSGSVQVDDSDLDDEDSFWLQFLEHLETFPFDSKCKDSARLIPLEKAAHILCEVAMFGEGVRCEYESGEPLKIPYPTPDRHPSDDDPILEFFPGLNIDPSTGQKQEIPDDVRQRILRAVPLLRQEKRLKEQLR